MKKLIYFISCVYDSHGNNDRFFEEIDRRVDTEIYTCKNIF